MYRRLRRIIGIGNGYYISLWKSKGERIKPPNISNYSRTSELDLFCAKMGEKFSGSCLKQDKLTFTHGKIVNTYTVYEISKSFNISNYPTLENCLFRAVTLTERNDIDEYKYFGYGVGFDRHGFFFTS